MASINGVGGGGGWLPDFPPSLKTGSDKKLKCAHGMRSERLSRQIRGKRNRFVETDLFQDF